MGLITWDGGSTLFGKEKSMGIAEDLRNAAVKLVNAGKFVIGSAVNQVGLQLQGYDTVRGESKGGLPSKKDILMVEEMKRQREMNDTQQESRKGNQDDRLKRLFDEPLNNATPPTKIFIRSRL